MVIQQIKPNMTYVTPNFGESRPDDSRRGVNAAATVTSAIGVAAAVAMIAKRQGFSLKPESIKNTNIKDWAIFKIRTDKNPDAKVLKMGWAEIMTMGIASVLGGLTGGALFDKKENLKSKCNEAVSQLVGDITIPLSFVAIPTMLYKTFEELPQKVTKHSKLQAVSKYIQGNKVLRILSPTLVSASSLATGIVIGNKVSNRLNEYYTGKKVDRGIRVTDFAPHLDDVCLAITLMASKSPLGDIISKFVPVALTVAGIETGKATPENRN